MATNSRLVLTLVLAAHYAIMADASCADDKFYCQHLTGDQCMSRAYRCVPNSETQCLNQYGVEDDCRSQGSNQYTIIRGSGPVSRSTSSSSSRKRRDEAVHFPAHLFIIYRGFTYEFGKSYDVKERDINDPNYKYKSGRSYYSLKEAGSSRCHREDILAYLEANWKNKGYHFWKNNCRHFYNDLHALLRTDCGRGSGRKRDADNETSEAPQTTDMYYSACEDGASAQELHKVCTVLPLALLLSSVLL